MCFNQSQVFGWPLWYLVPIGLFLIYKAMHDSQLFNKESYFRAFRKIQAAFKINYLNSIEVTL